MSNISANNKPTTIVEHLLCDEALHPKVESFSPLRVAQLIDTLHSSALHFKTPLEALLHIPKELLPSIDIKLRKRFIEQFGDFNTSLDGDNEDYSVKHECLLADEFIGIIIGKPVCIFITSYKPSVDSLHGRAEKWDTIISFDPVEISIALNIIKNRLTEPTSDLRSNPCIEWLSQRIEELSDPQNFLQSQTWGEFIIDLTSSVHQAKARSELELNWYQVITRIQDSVGWELDLVQLFSSTAQILKELIGYDIFEIKQISKTSEGWKIGYTHQINTSADSGKLVNLLLIPKCRAELLEKRVPVLVQQSDFEDRFANPRQLTQINLQSGMLVPLIHKGRPNGLIKVFSQKPSFFSQDDINRMEAIGRILARSIDIITTYNSLRRLAMVDPLTDVFNRRFFNLQIIKEMRRAKRYKNPLSLLMIDIDHFKQFNDNYGHLAGDRVLSSVAFTIKQCVRGSDTVARFGGEEFAVILPETDFERAILAAEKIRQAVEEKVITLNDDLYSLDNGVNDLTCANIVEYELPLLPETAKQVVRVTVSIGVATLSDNTEASSEFINLADNALYSAKKSGRNRVVA